MCIHKLPYDHGFAQKQPKSVFDASIKFYYHKRDAMVTFCRWYFLRRILHSFTIKVTLRSSKIVFCWSSIVSLWAVRKLFKWVADTKHVLENFFVIIPTRRNERGKFWILQCDDISPNVSWWHFFGFHTPSKAIRRQIGLKKIKATMRFWGCFWNSNDSRKFSRHFQTVMWVSKIMFESRAIRRRKN